MSNDPHASANGADKEVEENSSNAAAAIAAAAASKEKSGRKPGPKLGSHNRSKTVREEGPSPLSALMAAIAGSAFAEDPSLPATYGDLAKVEEHLCGHFKKLNDRFESRFGEISSKMNLLELKLNRLLGE